MQIRQDAIKVTTSSGGGASHRPKPERTTCMGAGADTNLQEPHGRGAGARSSRAAQRSRSEGAKLPTVPGKEADPLTSVRYGPVCTRGIESGVSSLQPWEVLLRSTSPILPIGPVLTGRMSSCRLGFDPPCISSRRPVPLSLLCVRVLIGQMPSSTGGRSCQVDLGEKAARGPRHQLSSLSGEFCLGFPKFPQPPPTPL